MCFSVRCVVHGRGWTQVAMDTEGEESLAIIMGALSDMEAGRVRGRIRQESRHTPLLREAGQSGGPASHLNLQLGRLRRGSRRYRGCSCRRVSCVSIH